MYSVVLTVDVGRADGEKLSSDDDLYLVTRLWQAVNDSMDEDRVCLGEAFEVKDVAVSVSKEAKPVQAEKMNDLIRLAWVKLRMVLMFLDPDAGDEDFPKGRLMPAYKRAAEAYEALQETILRLDKEMRKNNKKV
jgi:hypothetical protein